MTNKTKLAEKSARIPDIRESNWGKIIPEYLQSVTSQATESAKSHRFLILLKDLFGIQPEFIEDYVSGIEKFIKVRQKDRLLKGEVDNLFGNLIIEFERDLKKKLGEAEEQLKRHTACLWSQETLSQRRPYLCLATDGVNFSIFSPIVSDPAKTDIEPSDVSLNLNEKVDWFQLSPQEVYFWLDRYFLRKEILNPKSENIAKDFGVKSHAFQMVSQSLLSCWEKLSDRPDYQVVYESWEKYLKIVYGSTVTEKELFCRHTYLATLAKLMAWNRLSERQCDNDLIASVLSGRYFKDQGIENFLEENFFSWIVRDEAKSIGIENARLLMSLLGNYNLRELSEDVLKSLYQELVDPTTRHDLGEFYTPDWLAHRIIRKLMDENNEGSFLDPSCGSGTFLYLAIREKRNRLQDSIETLNHILDSVYGIDIHPLAVIVAKTNYLLALGDLLRIRGRISIPVYLSDTIRAPEKERAKDVKIPVWFNGNVYRVNIEDKDIYFSEPIIKHPILYDKAIECAKDFAIQHAGEAVEQADFYEFMKVQYSNLPRDQDTVQALFFTAKILKNFIEQSRDTIWAFILKNIYKPIFLRERFDFVVGNPPWLSFRYAEPSYQKFLNEQITKNYRLLSGRGELITHLELGTLFLLRSADLYLKEKRTIAFVLPKSIFTSDQHDGLRSGAFKGINIKWKEIWDLEEVSPLFNVPSCVLVARKKKDATISYPIPGLNISGKLHHKNSSLHESELNLSVNEVQFYLNKRGRHSYWGTEQSEITEKQSYYKKHFLQGATIVPRSFWFVDFVVTPSLGFDPELPPLESSERARKEAKNAYKELVMRGKVENNFFYATLLSTDMIPFGHLGYRTVVLPIEPLQNCYKLIDQKVAKKRQYVNLAAWLNKAEDEWQNRRGEKANEINAVEWLNYRNKLSSQNPQAKFRVLYNTSGTFLCSCSIKDEHIHFDIYGKKIQAKGFIADYVTYYFECDDSDEVNYLTSILNAPIIDQLIKPMQARGLWGARHICKKVFELPIPKFDSSNQIHLAIAALSEQCTNKVDQWLKSGGVGSTKSIGVLRRKVREMLSKELNEINELVKKIL